MTERKGLVPSHYFPERDDLTLGADEIVLISCMRNELLRLPFFLDYHRRLGFNRFLVVDNGSDDGTREYLATQPDVEYFYTDSGFLGSYNGRAWVQELAQTYAQGHWILFADADELLVYPGVEEFGIHDFCRYLDGEGYQGLFTVLLDLYSDRPLRETIYESGTDFRETCHFFDVASYRLRPSDNPPFISVWGGPRSRLLQRGDGPKAPFQQRKISMMKWHTGISYITYPHDARYMPLADVTGALLHFKYFATWTDRLARDHARGDRNPDSYAFYKARINTDLCYHDDSYSNRYTGSPDLVRFGVMATSKPLRQYYRGELRSRGVDVSALQELLPCREAVESRFDLRALAAVWPMVNNPGIGRYFGQLRLSPNERRRLVGELSESVRVVDVRADRILVSVGQRALHDPQGSGLALAVYVESRLLDLVPLDESATTLEADVDSLVWNIFRWHIDIGAAARRGDGGSAVEVFLVDTITGATVDAAGPGPSDIAVFARNWQHRPTAMAETDEYQGVVESYENGQLRGWALDVHGRTFEVPVAIYVDDRLVAVAEPSEPRPGLAAKRGLRRSAGRGFTARIPHGYFRDRGAATVRVDARIAGTNVSLARAPFELPTDAATLRWRRDWGWVRPVAIKDPGKP